MVWYILCVISLYEPWLHLCNTCCIAFWYLRMGNNSSPRPNLMYLLILCSDINQHFLTYISFSNGKVKKFAHKNMFFVQTCFLLNIIPSKLTKWILSSVPTLYRCLIFLCLISLNILTLKFEITVTNLIRISYRHSRFLLPYISFV